MSTAQIEAQLLGLPVEQVSAFIDSLELHNLEDLKLTAFAIATGVLKETSLDLYLRLSVQLASFLTTH